MSDQELKSTRRAERGASLGKTIRRLGKAVIHNWGWKLACLLLAVCLWGYIISADSTLPRTKTFDNGVISVIGRDALQRNGLIVVSGLEPEKLNGLRLTANVPQIRYRQVTAGSFNPRVDLSEIRSAGTQQIQVKTTDSTSNGEVTELSVTSLEIVVEEYVTRSRIPVQVQVSGEMPDWFYLPAPRVDPSYVTVTGPQSKVNGIVRCVALFDLSAVAPQSGTEKTAVPFILTASDGSQVDQTFINVSPLNAGYVIDSITVEQDVISYVKVPIRTDGAVTGEPEPGFRLENVIAEPDYVEAAPEKAGAQQGWTYAQLAKPVDITGLAQTTTFDVELAQLKDGIMRSRLAQLTVVIGPEPGDELPEDTQAASPADSAAKGGEGAQAPAENGESAVKSE